MNFFQKLFSIKPEQEPNHQDSSENDSKQTGSAPADYEFETLCDDGIRAMKMRAFRQAVSCFKGAIDRRDDPEVRSLLAETYLRSGQSREASELLSRLVEEIPDSISLWQALAWAANLNDDAETLERAACRLAVINPDDPNNAYCKARSAYLRQDYGATLPTLDDLLQAHPDHAGARLLRAQAHDALGQYAEAERDIDQLIADGYQGETVSLLKGRLRELQDDTDGALHVYLDMRERDPFSMAALEHLTDIYIKTGHSEEALKLLDEAVDWQPEAPEPYSIRSKARRAAGDDRGAEADLSKVEELGGTVEQSPCDRRRLEDQLNEEARRRNPFGF